ncbi:MAG: phage holin family protein [Burkholderiales bacterium]
MAGADSTAGAARTGGLLRSVKQRIGTLAATVQTRLQLLANDVHAESLRLAQKLLLGAGALIFLVCGVLPLTFLVIVLFWGSTRVLASGGSALLYFAIGAALAVTAARTRNCGHPVVRSERG